MAEIWNPTAVSQESKVVAQEFMAKWRYVFMYAHSTVKAKL